MNESIIIGILLGVLSLGIFYLLFYLTSKARSRYKKPKIKTLTEAESFFKKGEYEFVPIKTTSTIAFALKNHYKSSQPIFELLKKAKNDNLLSTKLISSAHSIRKIRNKIVHSESIKISKKQAEEMIESAKMISSYLGYEV